jgi:hypothetical protein
MNYKIIILAIMVLAIFTPTMLSRGIHCWTFEGVTTNIQSHWENAIPTNINIDGNIYDLIVLPGGRLAIDGFGSYTFRCDDGAGQDIPNTFVRLSFDDSNNYITNSTNGVAGSDSRRYCITRDGELAHGYYIGVGNMQEIEVLFNDINKWQGVHSYNTELLKTPLATTYESNPVTQPNASGNFIFSPSPSMSVFSEANSKKGFYNASGDYVKEIFFTLNSQTALDLNINNYALHCSGEKSCTVDPSNINYVLTYDEALMIISGQIVIDKKDLPIKATYYLDVNFSINGIEGVPGFDNDFSASSNITEVEVGLLDQQDFQIKIVGSDAAGDCVGVDGMIGTTGESVAPRINLGFGGTADIQDALISLDECDSDNPNWVYCSQREFMVEMSRKIAEIFKIRKQLNDAYSVGRPDAELQAISVNEKQFAKFKVNVRDLDLTSSGINRALEGFNVQQFDLQNSGLNLYSDEVFFGGTNKAQQTALMQALFSQIDFSEVGVLTNGSFRAGEYEIIINMNIAENISTYTLFDDAGNLNPGVSVEVEFRWIRPPFEDWFFYDNTIGDVFDIDIEVIEPEFYISNDRKRGVVFEFVHNTNSLDVSGSAIYKTTATPLFIRLANANGDTNNSFEIDFDIGLDQAEESGIFSYWSGFASSLGDGCEDIMESGTQTLPLVYNIPDRFTVENTHKKVYLDEYAVTKADGVEYLETVLFIPKFVTHTLERNIITPFNIYTTDSACIADGTNCEIDVTALNSSHGVETIQELFDGIESEEICVNSEVDGDNTNWTLFWNSNKILEDLDTRKAAITDATLCLE